MVRAQPTSVDGPPMMWVSSEREEDTPGMSCRGCPYSNKMMMANRDQVKGSPYHVSSVEERVVYSPGL